MIVPFDTQWSTEARFTVDRLPADVQTGLVNLLSQLVINYVGYYRELANRQKAVNTTPHIHYLTGTYGYV